MDRSQTHQRSSCFTSDTSEGTHREAGTNPIPGTRELRGCRIHIVPGGGFNIHRLVQHELQASGLLQQRIQQGRESLYLSWIDFSGEQINDGEADKNQWNACREERVERRLVDSDECFNHERLLGLI